MKIVLDIDKLLADGRITADEYERLKEFSLKETGFLAFNVLMGFGVIATAVGLLAMLPSPWTSIVVGVLLAGAGIYLSVNLAKEWGLLGSIQFVVGVVIAAGGVVALTDQGVIGYLIVAILCAAGAFYANSVLLSIMATLSLSASVEAMTSYGHATYVLVVQQPTLTILLFTILALAAYRQRHRLPPDHRRIAIACSRTSLFLVNLGFWVGSLWGDSLWYPRDIFFPSTSAVIPDWVFVIGWAVGIIAVGVWAVRSNKRWVVNLVVVFGAIHFYTQYFERLGASPGSILFAGLIAIAIAFGIFRYNQSAKPESETEPQVA